MVQTRSRIGGWPLTAAITVVLLFLFFVREILLPFILAAAIAFILTPVVDSLQARLKIPRWTVATAVYLCVVTIFGLLGYWVGGLLIKDATQIVRQFPQLLEKLLSRLVPGCAVCSRSEDCGHHVLFGTSRESAPARRPSTGSAEALLEQGKFVSMPGPKARVASLSQAFFARDAAS